jgi:glycerophosphoryl diester phosphodiesterase
MSGTLDGRPPLVIAHRGSSGVLPENTMPAFALAIEQRADMIETDLHRTRDGAIVIAHDEDLAGLGGCGEIADAALADVRCLDAGGGACVPTLDEILDGFGARVPFNLELKRGTAGLYDGLEAAVLAAVDGRGLQQRTLFSSFYDPVLGRVRALAPEARVGLLVSRRYPQDAVARAQALGAEALHPEAVIVDAALVEAAHGAGLAVYVYTVDDPGEMRRLLALGVDGLFTNYPDRMRQIVDAPRG